VLHVQGLGIRCDERDVKEKFEKIGKVEKVKLILDPHTKEPRGFCFVTMESSNDADEAIKQLNGSTIGNSKISIEKVNPKK
jgi:RNA recognition motif-containing protein